MKDIPLKVGVFGTGNMGQNHLRVLSAMYEYDLIGCYDINQLVCQELAGVYEIKCAATPEELFDAIDVAHITVPSFLHKEYAVAAAQAGCHVLVEKPIALTVSDAEDIIAACKNAGVRLCVGHVERFNPAIQTMLNIVENEELVSVDFRRMSPYNGRVMDASVVEDLMIHDIDVLNAITENIAIEHIASHGVKLYTDKLDYAQTLITYSNGFLASLTASRITEAKIRTAQLSAKRSFIDVDYLNRTVLISRNTNFSLDVGYPIQYKQENIIEKVFVPIKEPLRVEFEHFAHCIRYDDDVTTSGEMGLKALLLSQRIQDVALTKNVK